jgi:hypothetical protein
LVAVVVGDCLLVVVELVVVVGVLVVVLVVELVVDELVELVLEQSRAASALTVAAPWPRFWISVVLTLLGNPATTFENCCEAAFA